MCEQPDMNRHSLDWLKHEENPTDLKSTEGEILLRYVTQQMNFHFGLQVHSLIFDPISPSQLKLWI